MKNSIQKYVTFCMVLVLTTFAENAFSQTKKADTVEIKSSVVCQMCKDRVEGGLAFEKGVKDVNVDLETKIITIRYNPKSITAEDLRKKISKLGYDADDVPCDKIAYEKLPACCKKDAPKH